MQLIRLTYQLLSKQTDQIKSKDDRSYEQTTICPNKHTDSMKTRKQTDKVFFVLVMKQMSRRDVG